MPSGKYILIAQLVKDVVYCFFCPFKIALSECGYFLKVWLGGVDERENWWYQKQCESKVMVPVPHGHLRDRGIGKT